MCLEHLCRRTWTNYFTGKMVELLLQIDQHMYEPCVVEERGEKVLYVELLKALYGTLRAARLFWEKLSKKLQEWGFTMNPYDLCVVNKMVFGKENPITESYGKQHDYLG